MLELCRDGFPLSQDLIRLSSPPSVFADSYRYMHAYGALYRCQLGESTTNHVTFDSGIVRRLSEHETSGIDIGILKEILMVDYGALTPVVMKVSWIKHQMRGAAPSNATLTDSGWPSSTAGIHYFSRIHLCFLNTSHRYFPWMMLVIAASKLSYPTSHEANGK